MARPASPALPLTERQRRLLTQYCSKTSIPVRDRQRVAIILQASDGMANTRVALDQKVNLTTVEKWRERWLNSYAELTAYEKGVQGQDVTDTNLLRTMIAILGDAPRQGHPRTITEAEEQLIVALSCEKPQQYGHAVSQWTNKLLAKTAVAQGLVAAISESTVRRILKKKNYDRTALSTGSSRV